MKFNPLLEALKPKLSTTFDNALFPVQVLKKLDRASISTLKQRIVCQKLVYFGEIIHLMPQYPYRLYLHGPYSTELAKDLYSFSPLFNEVPDIQFASEELSERFEHLRTWSNSLSSEELELLATYDWFKRACSDSDEKAAEHVKKFKNASEGQIKWCMEKLAEFQK